MSEMASVLAERISSASVAPRYSITPVAGFLRFPKARYCMLPHRWLDQQFSTEPIKLPACQVEAWVSQMLEVTAKE